MNLRSVPWSGKDLAGVLGVAVLGGVWGGWMLWPRPGAGAASPADDGGRHEAQVPPGSRTGREATPARPGVPRRRRNHPSVADLRKQMLQHLHGHTEAVFVASEGFGLDRMPVVRQKLYEAPVFSPGDIETQGAVASPAPLREVLAESLARFQSPAGKAKSAGEAPRADGLQLLLLDLIGLRDGDKPRAYSGGPAFERVRLTSREKEAVLRKKPDLRYWILMEDEGKAKQWPKTRPLDYFELAGLAELREGKSTYVRHKDGVVRMLGALRATDQCLQCHASARLGDLLGALSYTIADTKRSLFKEAKKDPER
jgi:hypothetical protein